MHNDLRRIIGAIEFVDRLRQVSPAMVTTFKEGGCYQLAKMLEHLFGAKILVHKVDRHVVALVGGDACSALIDIEGFVTRPRRCFSPPDEVLSVGTDPEQWHRQQFWDE